MTTYRIQEVMAHRQRVVITSHHFSSRLLFILRLTYCLFLILSPIFLPASLFPLFSYLYLLRFAILLYARAQFKEEELPDLTSVYYGKNDDEETCVEHTQTYSDRVKWREGGEERESELSYDRDVVLGSNSHNLVDGRIEEMAYVYSLTIATIYRQERQKEAKNAPIVS